jgi:hypothetical protein
MSRTLVAACVLVLGAIPAAAQEIPDRSALTLAISANAANTGADRGSVANDGDQQPQAPVLSRPRFGERAGATLMVSLYATTATMQALDAHSTIRALDSGAVEANPIMGGIANNRAALIATKAAVAAGTIYAAHNVAKKNKFAAAITLIAINSAYAFIAHHNYKVARQLR